jgi:hypothetical protein
MSVVDDASKFLSVLNTIPLWLLSGCAVVGYAALFAPAFGGVDLLEFRRVWGPLLWLDAVSFSILSATYVIEHVARYMRARNKRSRQRDKNRYYNIYLPLYREMLEIKVTTSTSMMAPLFAQRVRNAYRVLTTNKCRFSLIRNAWRALFDKKQTPEIGEVEFGGNFPLRTIERTVKECLIHSDPALIDLICRADRTRMEDGVTSHEMTADDVRLFNHIVNEHDHLKRRVER